MAGDYLELEAMVVARIEEKLPELKGRVIGVPTIEDAAEYAQTLPAVFVIYFGDEIGDSAGDGIGQIFKHRYLVMPAVKNVRDTRGGTGARAEVGPMLFKINKAMLGWRPTKQHGGFRKGNSPRAPYMPGSAFFPQLFTTSIAMQGDST